MKCEACERGDHDNCGMQTWCDCDCEGYTDIYLPPDHYFADDLDGGRLVKKNAVEIANSQRMPEAFRVVRIAGGLGLWTGNVWLSQNGDNDHDRVIEWPVTWWRPLRLDSTPGA